MDFQVAEGYADRVPEKRPVPGSTWKKVIIESAGPGVGCATIEQLLGLEKGSKPYWDRRPLEDICSAIVKGTFPSVSPANASVAARLMADTARHDLDRAGPDWSELDSGGRMIARIITGEKLSDD